MLGKLLKYEFKATARLFLLMYAALLVLAIINAILIPLGIHGSSGHSFSALDQIYSVITGLSASLYAVMVVAVFVLSLVIIIVRFYRMFGNEGYLWFTLPATANQHFFSKLIVGFVWTIVSTLMILVSVGVLAISTGWIEHLHYIPEGWNWLYVLGFNPGLWLILFIVFVVVSVIAGIVTFYAAISIGPNIIKSRLGGTVLAYLIIYVIVQVISLVSLMVVTLPIVDQAEVLSDITVRSLSDLPIIAAGVNEIMVLFFVPSIISSVVICVAAYFVTKYFMTKKLNLA